MLSTDTRLRVEFICERISQGAPVELKDMAWLQKLAARNPTVDTWYGKQGVLLCNKKTPKLIWMPSAMP